MSDVKNITIGVKGDAKGLDPISKAVKALANDVERLQKIINQTSLSGNQKGGKPDSPFLNRTIAEEAALRKLAATSKDTASTIDRVLNRSMDAEAKQVENLTNKINQLNAATAKSGQSGRGGGIGTNPSINSNAPNSGGGGQGGGGGGNNNPIGRGAIPKAIRSAGIGAALVNILSALPDAYLNSINAPYQNRSAGASGFGGNLRRESLAGDVSSFFELVGSGEKDKVIQTSPGFSKSNSLMAGGLGAMVGLGPIGGIGLASWLAAGKTPQVNNSNLSNLEYAREASTGVGSINAVKGVIGGGVGAATLGATQKLGMTGGIGGIGTNFSSLTPEGRNAISSQALATRAQQMKQIDVKYQPYVEDIQQMSQSRLNAYRLYGGASAYRSVMGIGRSNQMTSEGEIQALQAQLSGLQGNDKGFNLFGAASRAPMELGISRSSAAGLLSGLTTGSGGDTGAAEQKLSNIFKKAFKEGISDSNLAEAIAEAAVDASSRSVSGTGGRFTGAEDMLLMALRGGPQDKAAIGLNQSVSQGLNGVLGSGSGLESVVRDRSFANAAKQMGIKNLGIGDIRTISSEPIQSLNSITDADKDFMERNGLNVDQMLQLKRSSVKQTMLGLASSTQVGGLSEALSAGSAEDANKIIQKRGLGMWLSSFTNTPNNPEANKQALQMILGNNFSPANVDLGPDRGLGTSEYQLNQAQSNIKGQMFNQEISDPTFKGQFEAATGAMQQFAIITKDFNNEEFRNAATNIHAVAEAITQLDDAAVKFLQDQEVLEKTRTK